MKLTIPETLKVLVFKNGVVLVIKQVTIPKEQSYILIYKPDYAIKGSFWVYEKEEKTKKDTKITSIKIVDFNEPSEEEICNCETYQELLKANKGEEVTISFHDQSQMRKGIIDDVKGVFFSIVEKNTKKVYVRKIVDIKDVYQESGQGLKLTYKKSVKSVKKGIQINCKKGKDDCDVYICYLMKNIDWYPSYKLYLDTEKGLANIKMQATLVNKAEDLKVKEFIFAGGNPKLEFIKHPDKFICGNVISSSGFSNFEDNRLNLTNRNFIGNEFSGSNFRQSLSNSSQKGTDYCLYPIKDLESEKDTRKIFPVFSYDLKFIEAYKCTLKVSDKPQEVTHIIKLANGSLYQWTAGPIIVESTKQLFAGQSKLNFTGIGSNAEIDIDTSLSVKVIFADSVRKSSPLEVKKNKKNDYRIIKMIHTGKLQITNYQNKSVILLIKHKINGKVDKGLKMTVQPVQLEEKIHHNINKLNYIDTSMTWELKVDKGKELSMIFEYSTWIKEDY